MRQECLTHQRVSSIPDGVAAPGTLTLEKGAPVDITHLEHTLYTDAGIVAALLIEGRTADADAHIERSGHLRRLALWREGRTRSA